MILTLRNVLVVALFVATFVRLVAVAIDPSRLRQRISRAAELPVATARPRSNA